MAQNVFITGTGRDPGLGYNFVRRYLEAGDTVFAGTRKESEALNALKEKFPDTLHIVIMEVSDTESVNKAAEYVKTQVDTIDVLINNAMHASRDSGKPCLEADVDLIRLVFDVSTLGAFRVIKALFPLIEKSKQAIIANISSEAGSIGACHRVNSFDYAMAKCAMNMGTMTYHNFLKDRPNINIITVHPGWMKTRHGDSAAPLDPYDDAEMMRVLFEKKKTDKDGPIFVTYTGEEYPW